MRTTFTLCRGGVVLCWLAAAPWALAEQMLAESVQEQNWLDESHAATRGHLDRWAHNMSTWFGEPDPARPASANLRLILDSEWDRYDGYTVKPRIRGKLRLPTLEQRLNVVFGDNSLDNRMAEDVRIDHNSARSEDGKRYDRKQTREDNGTLALRFSDQLKRSGLDADVDLGIRRGTDVYLRTKLGKGWQHSDDWSSYAEQIYRYGIKSKHYARSNYALRHQASPTVANVNQTHVQYTHDDEEQWSWGNSLYRQHDFAGNKRLNYGVAMGGDIAKRRADIQYYGPFVGWRQPIGRPWLFAQTELNYYNDKKADRPHHVGVMLRLEALF